MSRAFESLTEFDRYIATYDDRPESELVEALSNTHLADESLLDLPDDPFSAEYRDAITQIHATISGFAAYDASEMETWPVDVDAEVVRPAVYRNDGTWLADYLGSFSHVIRHLHVQPGMRVIDLGCGDAEIILHLARLGCDCVALDLHADVVEVIRRKARALGVTVRTVEGPFEDAFDQGIFDRVLFYQAFHHALGHQDLVARFDDLVAPGGRIVFGAEPVIDPHGPWATAVPYPWGPRLDGLSVRQMRRYGWMELGFQTPYFTELLARSGWSTKAHADAGNGLAASIVAERIGEEPTAMAVAVGGDANLPAATEAKQSAAVSETSEVTGAVRMATSLRRARSLAGRFRRFLRASLGR